MERRKENGEEKGEEIRGRGERRERRKRLTTTKVDALMYREMFSHVMYIMEREGDIRKGEGKVKGGDSREKGGEEGGEKGGRREKRKESNI
jgi:hypothetical protein